MAYILNIHNPTSMIRTGDHRGHLDLYVCPKCNDGVNLPPLSKIFEKKYIFNQFIIFLNTNSCFHGEPYFFTKGKSTTDTGAALLKHIDDV